jgi:biopolymer transport protein ExbD
MAGTQSIGEKEDNPVAINVTAMVDVIFCLCLFFMCSFKFKQLEGKIETWLPNYGRPGPVTYVELGEIRVFLRWDAASQTTLRKVGNRPVARNDEDLMGVVRSMRDGFRKAGKTEIPLLIDATPDVPWKDAVHILDLCKLNKIDRINFVAPYEYEPASRP